MDTLKFKTNINCSACLNRVTPFLNDEKGIEDWKVDLESDDRVLTVETSQLGTEEIQKTVEKAGFNAQVIS